MTKKTRNWMIFGIIGTIIFGIAIAYAFNSAGAGFVGGVLAVIVIGMFFVADYKVNKTPALSCRVAEEETLFDMDFDPTCNYMPNNIWHR